jgi:hypothetical protein
MGGRGFLRKTLDRRSRRVFEDTMAKPFQTPEAGERRSKPLTPAAERALAEAAARRAEIDARAKAMPKEHGGRAGPDPVRYGDWENKGIASDFS